MLRFVWQAGRGCRLRPWRSPYLRWRIETYSGCKAEDIGPQEFRRFLWAERRRLARYLRWAGAMRSRQGEPRPDAGSAPSSAADSCASAGVSASRRVT